MNRARIILVDDYEPALKFYMELLQSEVDIVATAPDGESAIFASETYKPDLLVLDIEMGAMNGLSVPRWLNEHMPSVKMVFVTMHAEPAYINEAARSALTATFSSEMQCVNSCRLFESC